MTESSDLHGRHGGVGILELDGGAHHRVVRLDVRLYPALDARTSELELGAEPRELVLHEDADEPEEQEADRLSTIADADTIHVLERGRIVESGLTTRWSSRGVSTTEDDEAVIRVRDSGTVTPVGSGRTLRLPVSGLHG